MKPESSKSWNGLLDRRSFLQMGAAAATLPKGEGAPVSRGKRTVLPPIPALEDLASEKLVYQFTDLFSPPAAQNEWGYLKASKSVSGITSISFPPYACCGIPEMEWSPGYLLTCELFLNGRVLMSYAPGEVSFRWYPHEIVREMRADGVHFSTRTFMPPRQRAVAEWISVRNAGKSARRLTLGFDLRAAVTDRRDKSWFVNSYGEKDNRVTYDAARGCLVFEAQHSRAVSVQGISPRPQRCDGGRMLVLELTLGPGEEATIQYFNAIGESVEVALAAYESGQRNFAELQAQTRRSVEGLIRSAFTPANADFSGHLPQLHTRDHDLWRLYYTGFANLLFGRRASPDSAYGTTYLSLGGRVLPTLSFPWDTSLTSMGLALLDPEPLRRLVETWFVQDMDQHLATDYVSGRAVGPWYAVNDMAIVTCAYNYLRVTGDFAWLDRRIEGKPVLEHLAEHALRWKRLDQNGHGLADYGKLENLLEVVSTYIHEVPAMNAGNVFSMRFVASLLERRGEAGRAAQLRTEANELASRIVRNLYVEGKGFWRCGQPDGSYLEVRHCYDFLTLLDLMDEDLSEKQKKEMAAFFWRELQTPLWMRALSTGDVDATWNIRPDHSWLGAYPAWPPMSAKGLYKIEPSARVAAWVRGLAKAASQGPIGQAHFVETVFPPVKGGACKCPEDPPYLTDFSCTSAGCFAELVIDSIFGVNLTLFDGLRVNSRLSDFDPEARLTHLKVQGKSYAISRQGAILSG
jgi:hypothetical protein